MSELSAAERIVANAIIARTEAFYRVNLTGSAFATREVPRIASDVVAALAAAGWLVEAVEPPASFTDANQDPALGSYG